MSASYESIWNAGRAITGGFGFWAHHNLLHRFAGPKDMVRAWVDGLREKGYSDIDIVFYGDWKEARWIGDEIGPDTTYAQFKKIVMKRSGSAPIASVGNQNYATEDPKRWELAQRALHGEVFSPGNW